MIETKQFINMISECSKLTQNKYKTRHDRVGKMIHLELCKKFQFDLTAKWYMHKLESILDNMMQKPHWDLGIERITLSWLEEQKKGEPAEKMTCVHNRSQSDEQRKRKKIKKKKMDIQI